MGFFCTEKTFYAHAKIKYIKIKIKIKGTSTFLPLETLLPPKVADAVE